MVDVVICGVACGEEICSVGRGVAGVDLASSVFIRVFNSCFIDSTFVVRRSIIV